MSDPYRARVCGECGRPHDPPDVCRRCGNPLGAPLLGRPACALCALRAAPSLAKRALRAGTVFFGQVALFLFALYVALVFGAVGIYGLGGGVEQTAARDFSTPAIIEVETAIRALEASPPSPPPPAPPKPAPSVCPRELSDLTVPRVLSGLGQETRDPYLLMVRASRLDAAGFEVDVTRVVLPPGVVERARGSSEPSAEPPSIVPVRWSGGVAGVCLEDLGSLPQSAGIQRGDVITSINGVPIVRPDLALEAYESARREGMAVIELLRGERRLIVSVTFPDLRRGALGPPAAGP